LTTDINLLQTIPLFRDLPENDLQELSKLLAEWDFKDGEEIVQLDQSEDGFYIVQSGQVQLSLRDEEGRYAPLDVVEAGEFFGEVAMVTGEPRQVIAKALTTVRVLELDRDIFFTFLEDHPTSAKHALVGLGRRLQETEHLLQYTASQNPNVIEDKRETFGQRIADVIADFSGSLTFLALNAVVFVIWILINQAWSPIVFDPFPFGFLTMSVSLEAIFLSIFVLISQNRQASKDRIKADLDYQVNLKAELEVGLILKELRLVQERVEILQESQAHFHSQITQGDSGKEQAPGL
jgi:CRP/FNR family cyclic AMP-dependent transcriptional regulator